MKMASVQNLEPLKALPVFTEPSLVSWATGRMILII